MRILYISSALVSIRAFKRFRKSVLVGQFIPWPIILIIPKGCFTSSWLILLVNMYLMVLSFVCRYAKSPLMADIFTSIGKGARSQYIVFILLYCNLNYGPVCIESLMKRLCGYSYTISDIYSLVTLLLWIFQNPNFRPARVRKH